MTDNGLAALAAALLHQPPDYDPIGMSDGYRREYAAAILADGAVFLPDGRASNAIRALSEQGAFIIMQEDEIAALRAALDGLVAAGEYLTGRGFLDIDGETGDEECHWCGAWGHRAPDVRHEPDCEWSVLRAALATAKEAGG